MDFRGCSFGRRNMTRHIIHTAIAFAGRADGPPEGRSVHGVCRPSPTGGRGWPVSEICYVPDQSYYTAVNGGTVRFRQLPRGRG